MKWKSFTNERIENLNADKLDNYEAEDFPRKAENAVITGNWTYSSPPNLSLSISRPNYATLIVTDDTTVPYHVGGYTRLWGNVALVYAFYYHHKNVDDTNTKWVNQLFPSYRLPDTNNDATIYRLWLPAPTTSYSRVGFVQLTPVLGRDSSPSYLPAPMRKAPPNTETGRNMAVGNAYDVGYYVLKVENVDDNIFVWVKRAKFNSLDNAYTGVYVTALVTDISPSGFSNTPNFYPSWDMPLDPTSLGPTIELNSVNGSKSLYFVVFLLSGIPSGLTSATVSYVGLPQNVSAFPTTLSIIGPSWNLNTFTFTITTGSNPAPLGQYSCLMQITIGGVTRSIPFTLRII